VESDILVGMLVKSPDPPWVNLKARALQDGSHVHRHSVVHVNVYAATPQLVNKCSIVAVDIPGVTW